MSHRKNIVQGGVFVLLIVAGVLLRIALQGTPNLAPVAAMALFAGYYFGSFGVAIVVPLAIMTISDAFIGGYESSVLVPVYGAMAFPVLLRPILRRVVRRAPRRLREALASFAAIAACSLAGSLVFFVVSNLGVWWTWHPHTLAELWQCMAQAIPFFRYTLAGDQLFACGLFGGHMLATAWLPAPLGERTTAGSSC